VPFFHYFIFESTNKGLQLGIIRGYDREVELIQRVL
jgi:hypothetical protein